jgi:urea carboxylase-associated protein 2
MSDGKKPDTSTTHGARDHARAMAGTKVTSMPTVPAAAAKDLPPGVAAASVIWDETLGPGAYASRVLPRGARLRLTNLDGDGCIAAILFNADNPAERLNIADTVKVQWNAYLGRGRCLLSDMGRVLASIVDDTSDTHDTFSPASTARGNAEKYGAGDNHGPHPNARDRFTLALLKHGLERRDIPPNVTFFKGVRIALDGTMTFVERPPRAGEHVELRAEMNLLVVFANTPHVLDPRSAYVCTPVRVTAWRGPLAGRDDEVRRSTPEMQRAFENVDEYYAQ